jgi:hypothetical protein
MRPFVLFVVVALFASTALAQQAAVELASDLAPPRRLSAAGKPIDVAGFAAPYIGDYDGDGRQDLLVGQFDFGMLRIYRNFGSDTHPAYGTHQWFEAGGDLAGIPSGCAIGFTPQLVDFDGDGRTDVLTGSFCGGVLFAFRRADDGTFLPAEVIEDRFGDVQLTKSRYNSTVFAHDWDSDGDLDLITGRSSYSLSRNRGTTAKPRFDVATNLSVGGKEIPRGVIPPVMADWDGDGRDDLIAGRGYEVVWYRNLSNVAEPEFDAARVLIGKQPVSANRNGDLASRNSRIHAVCVADYDSDGHLDLVVGDHYVVKRELSADQLQNFKQTSQARSDFSRRYLGMIKNAADRTRASRIWAFQAALADWRDLSAVPTAGPPVDHGRLERHGRVWLYRRIPGN